MAKWIPRARPPAGNPVVVRIQSMLGNSIYEIASFDSGKWTLQNGEAIERPDWIVEWTIIPELPPRLISEAGR